MELKKLPTGALAPVSYYENIRQTAPTRTATIPEVYELIRADIGLRDRTHQIIAKHGADMAGNFPNGKTKYQADKRDTLPAVCFAGNIDRSTLEGFQHTGRITLDLDENTPQEMRILRFLVEAGKLPFIEACGYSISGLKTGFLWANAAVTIPTEAQGDYKALEDLHKRYFNAIGAALADILILSLQAPQPPKKMFQQVIRLSAEQLHLLGITSGYTLSIRPGNNPDLKRSRYLAYDKSLIVRQAQPVKYDHLLNFERLQQQQQDVQRFEQRTATIAAKDHFDYCHQFAVHHGYTFTPGQRNEYLARFCIAANLLGVPAEDVEGHIQSCELSEHRRWAETLRGAYRRYSESFGVWEGRVKTEQHAFLPMQVNAPAFMEFDKHLADNREGFARLLHQVAQLRRPLLIVPTGSGKTFSTIREIRQHLKTRFPDKVFVFASPLRAITEQVGIGTDMQIVCEGQTSARAAAFTDTICTVKSFVDWSAELERAGLLEDVILVFDELHELITGADYQNFEALPAIFNRVFKVIGLTATPLKPLIEDLHFEPIRCERRQDPAVDIRYRSVCSRDLYKECARIGKGHRGDKVLFFYNGKARLEKLAKAARRNGIKADYFHADLKKGSATYDHLIKNGTLPEGTDHLYTTKILGFGTSFTGIDRIVYITRPGEYDFLEFVQTYARLRAERIAVTVLILEPENAAPKTYRQYDFNRSKLNYKARIFQAEADIFNAFDESRAAAGAAPLKNNLPADTKRFVRRCPFTSKYQVYDLGLWREQYQAIVRSFDADDFVRLLHTVPNATVTEDTGQAAISAAEQAIIDQVEAEHKATEKGDRRALMELMQDNPDGFLRHIEKGTQDARLKKTIRERQPYPVDPLPLEDRELVERRWKDSETAARRYLHLTEHYAGRFDTGVIVEYCFLKSYKYGRLLRQLASLDNVQRAERGEDVDLAAKATAKGALILKVLRAHQAMIRFCQQHAGQEMTSEALHHLAKGEQWFNDLRLTNKRLTEEIKLLFKVKRRKSGAVRFVTIGPRIDLDELLTWDILDAFSKKQAA